MTREVSEWMVQKADDESSWCWNRFQSKCDDHFWAWLCCWVPVLAAFEFASCSASPIPSSTSRMVAKVLCNLVLGVAVYWTTSDLRRAYAEWMEAAREAIKLHAEREQQQAKRLRELEAKLPKEMSPS